MVNINVAVLGEEGYGRAFGRKGTVSDITFYDFKSGEDTITAIEPSKYPEKFASLFYSLSVVDYVVIVVRNIDSVLGEMILTVDTLGVKKGGFVMKDYHVPEEMAPLVKGTNLEHFEYLQDDEMILREHILKLAKERKAPETKTGSVPVDHFFNVKGVGTVILGVVVSGTVRKHDELKVLPGDKTAFVRSIQKHDDDFDVSTVGDRVGLALKNIESDELDRGMVLTNEDLKTTSKLNLLLRPTKFWKKPIEQGMVLFAGHWMQFQPAHVESVEKQDADYKLVLSLEKPMVLKDDSHILLAHIDTPKLRVVGRASLI
jgi:selenocysteine-specific translation elongation factor